MSGSLGGPFRGLAGVGRSGVERGTLRYTPHHLSARAGGGPPLVSPTFGPSDRGTQAPPRSSEAAWALFAVLALGLVFRLIIAYVLVPGSGFGVDRGTFQAWAADLAAHGPAGFYGRPDFFVDYTPGYLYVLWLVGLVGQALGGVGDLIKLPPILADVALGYLVHRLVRELGGSRRAALLGALLVVANPVAWFDSAIWGQVDSFGVVFVLLGLGELLRGRPERAAILAALAAIVKPQLGILVPILVVVLLRRHLWDWWRGPAAEGAGDREGAGDPWLDRLGRGPVRLVTSAVAALATAWLACLPFNLSIPGLLEQVAKTAGGYPYLTANAYNPWALLSRDGDGLAANGQWLRDAAGTKAGEVATLVAGIPAVFVGTGLLVAVILAVCLAVFRGGRPSVGGVLGDQRVALVGLTILAIAFFVVPTRVHERYLFPFFALGAILAATSVRWRIAYVVLSLASFANLYAILLLPFYDNPGVQDWLGIAGAIRTPTGIAIVALAHLAVFLWALTELRAGALRRGAGAGAGREPVAEAVPKLPGEAARDPRPTTALPVRAAPATWAVPSTPSSSRPPAGPDPAAWEAAGPSPMARRSRIPFGLGDLPALLPDRSRRLHREGGGRFGRLDLWLLVVLVVAALTLRTFRLAEPYRMHFDEVYHARTATEFLQDWRYGQVHAIYEFTHPHLAKYAMAVGIMAFGDDRVTAQRDLGTEVRDVLVEPRWDDPTLPDGRAGDRFYVAGGDRLRAYDLATRQLVGTWAVPGARTLALDATAHRLLVGTDGGTIAVLETGPELDALRATAGASPGSGPGLAGEVPQLAPLADVGAAVDRLALTGDGTGLIAATSTGDLVSLDPTDGSERARLRLAGIAGLADGGLGDGLTADPASVSDPAAAARALATIVGGDAATYQRRLGGDGTGATGSVVVLGGFAETAREVIVAAIGDGRLTGFSVTPLPRIAVSDATGVAFVAPATGEVVDTVETGAAARGLARVEGIDKPALYVALADRRLAVVKLGEAGGASRPALDTTFATPGDVRSVAFDEPTLMVHVLGRSPDGSADTVYVVEPHANAIYADARLPFSAAAWAIDADPDRPSVDREALLVASATGTLASIDVGDHAFAWRLPGVLAGSLMVGLVFLLVRLLFRRRDVAVIAGLLVLVDGMLFVQSRIAMNDVYVGLFIVAAYTLFAPLWTGRWRWAGAFWLVMPVVGLLLGLALASKWVGLYAIAGLGVLILGRSALGRILLILGLVVGTTVLGIMAMTVAKDAATSGGNLVFVGLMIGATLAAVLVTVLHPIAWSPEETRLAIAGPAVAGIVVFLVAIPLGVAMKPFALGPVQATPVEAALALLVASGGIALILRFAGGWGLGPLAPPPDPDDPVRLAEPAAPAPEGWLRPGAMLGLPILWAAVCLLAIPLAVYVVSYLPWVALGNRLTEHWPPGNAGQTLLELTKSMYDYHNGLRATHAASSPFWAWPFDLKPVWFYQGSFSGGTSAAIYDAGNLIAWWLSIPAMAFVAWQAFKRRSLALGLVFVAFAFQWLPWTRIDRATFQYHYYTSVPFLLVALAYFVAELRNGASRAIWLAARLAAALAVLGPALLWLLKSPLCAYVRVEAVNKGSQACVATAPGQIVLTARVAGLLAVLLVFGAPLVVQVLRLNAPGGDPARARRRFVRIGLTALAAVAGLVLVSLFLDGTPLFSQDGFRIEPIAAAVLLALLPVAWVVATARDGRRFAAGIVLACVVFFVVWYPNLSALPLPNAVVNAYQGFLPTYLYAFQFPVNTDPVVQGLKLLDLPALVLFGSLLATCVIVGYSAWGWRISAAERAADERLSEGSAPARPGT